MNHLYLKVMQRNFIGVWFKFSSLYWCGATGGPISAHSVLGPLVLSITEEVRRRKQILALCLEQWSLSSICHLVQQLSKRQYLRNKKE